jgi:hypothetical protein
VHRYEGTVNRVMGDGIMVLFGAPLAHEDHAVRACYAALRMQESLKRYANDARRSHGVEVQIRVGLNSGEVVVGPVSSDRPMDYTAVGQTAHLAARMEQLAVPGRVLLTAGTLLLAEGFVQVTPLGPVPIKGLGEPVEVFELTGPASRAPTSVAARRPHACGSERGDGSSPAPPTGRPSGTARWSPWLGSRARASRALLGAHPFHRARLARREIRLSLLRQGHRLPSRDRTSAVAAIEPRRPAEDSEKVMKGPDARPRRSRPPCPPCWRSSTPVIQRPGRSTSPAAPADADAVKRLPTRADQPWWWPSKTCIDLARPRPCSSCACREPVRGRPLSPVNTALSTATGAARLPPV